MCYQYIIMESVQTYWHLSIFLESKKPESEDEGSFPSACLLRRLSPHRCYVVCTYISFILCMYIYIYMLIYSNTCMNIYI